MRVVCENCGATYKIPDTKLVKEVNKATCRKCGFRMMIRRPPARGEQARASSAASEASTVVTESQSGIHEAETRVQHSDETEWSEEAPTQMKDPNEHDEPEPVGTPIPAPDATSPRVRTASRAPRPGILLPLFGACTAGAGTLLLAWNVVGSTTQRSLGLFLGMFGALVVIWWAVATILHAKRFLVAVGVVGLAALAGASTALMSRAIIQFEAGGPLLWASTAAVESAEEAEPADEAALEEPAENLASDLADEAAPALADVADALEQETTEAIEEVSEAVEEVVEEVVEEIEQEEDPEEQDESDRRRKAERERLEAQRTAEADERQRLEAQRTAEADERQRLETLRRADAEERQRLEAERKAKAANTAPRMKKLPLTVVDTMLRSNFSVKRCFGSERKRTGRLPKRVSVKFTVLPTGAVSSARVTNPEFKGQALDSCLRRAFKAIRFPAFEGQAMSMTYPFVM